MPADDAPQQLADHNLRRAIFLERVAERHGRDLARLVREAVDDLAAQIRALDPEDITRPRLESLIQQYLGISRQIDSRLFTELSDAMQDIVSREIASQAAALQGAQIAASTNLLTASTVYAAAVAEPITGKPMQVLLTEFGDAQRAAIAQALRLGYAEGESAPQIARRLQGTRSLNYADGVTARQQRQLIAISRTATTHFSAHARQAVYDQSPELLDGYQWLSVLDSRTTAICQARSGKVYQKGGPLPPAHVACRSQITPAIRGMGLPPIPSYTEWLRRQPAGFVDDLLGPTRAKLFRDGNLHLDRFVNLRTGRQYTLDELARREQAAWSRAGLDEAA